MADSTIISASLDDKELQASINSMVSNFDKKLNEMVTSTNNTVQKIKESLQGLGNLNFEGVSADGGSTKRTKRLKEESKAAKETQMSYDRLLGALQMAQRQERLLSSKNLFSLSREELDKYADAIKRVEELQDKLNAKTREMALDNVMKHQGVTDMREYITSLMKPNESLKRLNDDYKEWEKTSKKTTQSAIEDFTKYSDEIQKQAKNIRDSVEFKKEGRYQWTEKSGDTMVVSANEKKYGSVEEQLARMQQIRINNARELFAVETKTTDKATDLERIRERQAQLQEQYLASRKTEEEIQENIKRNTKEAADALNAARDNQGRISNLSDNFRYESTIDDLKRLEDAYNNLNDATKRSQLGKDVKKYIDELKTSLTSLGDKMQDDQLEAANLGNAYVTLSRKLTRLNTIYEHLNETERNSERGKGIADSIQRTARAMQEIQSQKMRPKSLKDVLELDEKTLDDIVYKMQMLQRYRFGLDANTQKGEIEQVNEALKSLGKTQRQIMGENESLLKSNNALARSFNYMKNRLAFYFTVGASTAFVNKLIEIRSQYELTERALGILVDSASRGSRIFNELSNMSLMSPYTLIELSNAAKQLTAFDIAAKDVVDTTRRLADMAAAVGAPIERLTYALGQIKAYGYLNSRDARMFANAGIPLVKELSNYYSELEGRMVTVADVYDKMKKKAIDYSDVMNVVNKLTDEGGKFYDFQAKMADTLKVKLANLNLAYNNMLNDMGKSSGGIIQGSIKVVTVLMKHWREFSRILGTVVTTMGVYRLASKLANTNLVLSTDGMVKFGKATKKALTSLNGFKAALGTINPLNVITAAAAVASYFIIFNRSTEETKQQLADIESSIEGVRKEARKLFVDATKTDNFGVQISKLKEMIELAETELHITIPVDFGDIDVHNIQEKLKYARNEIEQTLYFSQAFSEAAVGSDMNEKLLDFGTSARQVFTEITESTYTVIESLQKLVEEGKASAEEVQIMYELIAGQSKDESSLEYLQRLINLYERLNLVGEKQLTFRYHIDPIRMLSSNVEELLIYQREELDKLEINNKRVFSNMLFDVIDYYKNATSSQNEFVENIERLGEKIHIYNIPIEKRTVELEAAIDQEAARNNWNSFAIQFAKQVANEKFGTQIVISDSSKKNAEQELQEWQTLIQAWAKQNGIEFTISFQADDTPKEFADRMGKQWKDAVENYNVLSRSKFATKTEVDTAKKIADDYKKLAAAAGYDTSETKGRAKTETELQKALKEEIQLLDKARSVYKQLTKEGVESNRALTIATEGYEETITHINSVLQKYGIQKFNLAAYAGVQSPRAVLDMLQGQLDALVKSGVAKPEEIKDLQVKLKDIKVDAVSFDQKTLADSLNNELGKLKEEYELGVEFDANPELGGVFADMMGLSKDELEKLPRDFEGVVRKLQQIVDEQMGEGSFNVRGNLNKKVFDEYLKQNEIQRDSEVAKRLEAIVDYANKIRQDETKKQIDDWNKLLEKYAEYEYKRLQIEKDYQRELEVARKKGADGSVIKALENEKNRRIASLDFEQFQRSSDWIIATGNLAGLTNDALGMLIRNIEEYKKRAKDLSPKEIKQINNALKQLRNEQRKGNPFLFFKTAMEEMKSRTQEVKDEMDSYGKVLDEQNEKIEKGGKLTEEEEKKRLDAIENIKKLKGELKKLGKIDLTTLINGISGIAQVSNQAASAVASIASALGDKDTADIINGIGNVMNQTASMAATGAAIGGVIGAIGGGVLGFASGFISSFGEIISGNRDITEAVERSERAVKKLAITYSNLSNEIENTYGVAITGLKQAQIENKKLQLAETERQLRLEQSRKSKYRDEDKILDLKSKVQELRNEIVNDAKDIVNELLGISSAGDGITSLVDTMIEAFKNGEDAMEAFGKKWDEMIDNMIAKLLVSQYMQEEWDKIMEYLREKEKEFTVDSATKKADAQAEIDYLNTASPYEAARHLWDKGVISNKEFMRSRMGTSAEFQTILKMYMNRLQNELDEYDKALADASMDYTEFSIEYMSTEGKKQLEERAQMLKDALGEWFTFGENEEQKLSNLQQGITGITEDTAGALEAMLNGMSQQMYNHTDILIEMRDIMRTFNFDVQLGVQGQILLQLQNAYQVQMSIQSILQGWSNATGMAMRVEMV